MVHPLEQRLAAWAASRPDVQSLVVIGSYARPAAPGAAVLGSTTAVGSADGAAAFSAADEWSDLDVLAFVHDSEAYAQDLDWLEDLGQPWLIHMERIFRDTPDWMLSLQDGTRLDIAFVGLSDLPGDHLGAWLAALDLDVFRRGLRVLLDKSAAPALPVFPPLTWPAPQQVDFERSAAHFLYAAMRAARFLRRGDLWRARRECDQFMAERLLELLEWHAHAQHGPGYDTWYGGRSLEQWADARAVQALPGCFGGYRADALRGAILRQVELFGRLGGETAGLLGLAFPGGAFQRARAWLAETL